MKGRVKCPECNGTKGTYTLYSVSVVVGGFDPAWRYHPCTYCEGTGEISDLQWAIYQARGGSPPIIPQEFS